MTSVVGPSGETINPDDATSDSLYTEIYFERPDTTGYWSSFLGTLPQFYLNSKFMKNILKATRSIIVFIVTIVIIYGILGNFSSKNATIFNVARFSNFVVLTGSMEPGISPGDYITIRKVNPDKLKVNDIVTYKINQVVVTHQIVKIDGDKITTQGTANNVADNPISKSDILGKYVFKLPKIGYIMAFLSSISGLILIIGVTAIAIFWELSDPERGRKIAIEKNPTNDLKYSDEEYAEFLEFKKKIQEKENPKVINTETTPIAEVAAVEEKEEVPLITEKRISRRERNASKH